MHQSRSGASCARRATVLALALLGARAQALPPAPALPSIGADTVLLVVAPHPDDETLCCAGVMQRVVRAGGRVSVVWLTSGDAARLPLLRDWIVLRRAAQARALGERRMAEARVATALLGVPPAGQIFLGYPDGGLLPLLTTHRSAPYTSGATGAAAVPYRGALFPGHAYTGTNLERDLTQVVRALQPTLLLVPSPLDEHPDHRAAGLLASTLTAQLGRVLTVRYWIVHGGEGWPSPRGLLAGIPLTPPPLAVALAPAPFSLIPAEEDGKLAAIKAYATQMQGLAPFLLAFVRTNELFSARATPQLSAR